MKPTIFPPIPLDTAEAAQGIFGSSNIYMVIGVQAEALFDGICLQSPSGSSPNQVHWLAILYLTTIFQHLETLPNPLAADALRERLDWKYALHLPLKPAPMEASMLCEFRKMVSFDPASQQNFQKLLERLFEVPQIALCPCIRQSTDQVVAHVCRISRLATIWEAINQALQALATRRPEWLLTHSLPYWYGRYSYSRRNLNLRAKQQEQEAFAQTIGSDGFYLLEAISGSGEQELADLPEVIVLCKVWNEQFERELGEVIWRKETCAGCFFSGGVRSATLKVFLAQKKRANKGIRNSQFNNFKHPHPKGEHDD